VKAAVALLVFALATALPADSLYRLDLELTGQSGAAVRFEEAAKGPAMVSMFYASCPHTCPIIVTSIRLIEQQLAPEEREKVRVLMVSFDPERDTPEKLMTVAKDHRVDLSRWTFARAEPGDVRLLAAALDVRYRQLPDGEFNHSAMITLIDRDGRPVKRTSRLGEPDPEFVAAVRDSVK
jgi:protein SCO1/2